MSEPEVPRPGGLVFGRDRLPPASRYATPAWPSSASIEARRLAARRAAEARDRARRGLPPKGWERAE